MKSYVLLYDNRETNRSGIAAEFESLADPRLMIAALFPNMNPTTTLTLVEV